MSNRQFADLLRSANPWWSRKQRCTWPEDDPQLAQRARHEQPEATRLARALLSDLERPPRRGVVTLILGPWGVGKTTAVKDHLLRLLADPVLDPRAVVLVPVDRLPSPGVSAVLARPSLVGVPACDGDRLWVLDELTAAPGWPGLLDLPSVARGEVLATGSAVTAADLAALGTTHPSPRTVRTLRPLTLLDLARLSTDPAAVRTEYLHAGGLPRAAAEWRDLGEVSAEFVDELADDLRARTTPGCEAMSLISALCATTERRVDLSLVAARLALPEPIVAAALDRLVEAGVLDPHAGLVDPLLHWLPHLVDPAFPPPTEGHVAASSR